MKKKKTYKKKSKFVNILWNVSGSNLFFVVDRKTVSYYAVGKFKKQRKYLFFYSDVDKCKIQTSPEGTISITVSGPTLTISEPCSWRYRVMEQTSTEVRC